jgi:hypothetical protein
VLSDSVNVTVAPKVPVAVAPTGTSAVTVKTPGDRSAIATITFDPVGVSPASPVREVIDAETSEFLAEQSVFFPCVIVVVRGFEPMVPFVTAPKSTSTAVTDEAKAHSPIVPLTPTGVVAKAADVPIKVVTPNAMIAIAANLDLLDFTNIFDSPYFFSQDWVVPDPSQSYLEIAVFCCQKLGLTPVLRG